MRVKCREYTGELIEMQATAGEKLFYGEHIVTKYKITIDTNNGLVELKKVNDSEIEFI